MEQLHVLYAVVGSAAVGLALVSRAIRRLPVSEPLVALVLGVVLGPLLLDAVAVSAPTRDLVLLEGARLLLALSVMAAALRFPARSLRDVARAVVVLLLLVLPLAALVAGASALLLGLPLAAAAVVGACLSPTDPVLAASVVSGEPAQRDLPSRLRRMLTVESGINDGLALPLVGAALAWLLSHEAGATTGRLLWEVVGALVIGALAGWVVGRGVRWATRDHDLEQGPELVVTLLLAVAVLGLTRLADADGVLAVFVAGVAYNLTVSEDDRGPQEDLDEAVNRYAVLPLLAFFGIVLPWQEWLRLGPVALLFVLAVLLLRRLPFVLLLRRPLGLGPGEGVFAGWFGPMGVSALFYLAHARHEGAGEDVWVAGSLLVAVSVVVFGLTGTPGRRWYARTAGDGVSDDDDPAPDDGASGAGPVRRSASPSRPR